MYRCSLRLSAIAAARVAAFSLVTVDLSVAPARERRDRPARERESLR